MSLKFWVFLGMTVGSVAGSYLPVVFGAGWLSYTSVAGSTVGGLAGIWLGYKASKMLL